MALRINLRPRLPVWGLRLIFGAMLLVFSEIVMWQNPPVRSLPESALLLVLYTAMAAGLLDLAVRFQAKSIPSMLLISGAYSLVHSAALNPGSLYNLPISLIVRGLGLQTGAALYGLLFFVSVMRGKQPNTFQVIGALVIGALWGIWVHWYPIQLNVNWGLVKLETAQVTLLVALAVAAALTFGLSPRFKVFREKQLELLWWEAIAAIAPLFIALVVGMVTNAIPVLALIIIAPIGAYVGWALNYQQKAKNNFEPSILAEMTFTSPNVITYVILAIIFLAAGSFAYSLIAGVDSPIGVGAYIVVLILGAGWLPGASVLIFWDEYQARQRTRQVTDQEDLADLSASVQATAKANASVRAKKTTPPSPDEPHDSTNDTNNTP